MAELNKGSVADNKAWSSEQEIVEADVADELSDKEKDREKDISDEVSFHRQTKFSKTDAENITKKALGDSAFKRPDKLGTYKEISTLSPDIRNLWKKTENKRIAGKSQIGYARNLLKKEGIAEQEKMKLESGINALDERDAAFEDIGNIILKEKNPNEISKAIQNLLDAYKINQQEFQKQIKEQSGNIRAQAGLQRLSIGINILLNYKNAISKIINTKEKNMTSKESSIIDSELKIDDPIEGGGVEQKKSLQEVIEVSGSEIVNTQGDIQAEAGNNDANIEQKSEGIKDPLVKDQIRTDAQKSNNEVVSNGIRISKESLEKLKGIKNGQKPEAEAKNPEIQALQNRADEELRSTQSALSIFEKGKSDELDLLVEQLAAKMGVRGDLKSDGVRGYIKSGLEDRKKVLYRTGALLSQSKSSEEFYGKINNELDQLLKNKNNELEQFAQEKNTEKKRKEEKRINNKYNFRKGVFGSYLPLEQKSEPAGEPQEPRVDEPKIDAKPADVQPDSQLNGNERDEIAAAYDQRIANLRLGVNEAKESGNKNEAARLEKFARELEHEKKWRLRNADDKDQGKGKNKDIKPQVQNKDVQVSKDKAAEPKNFDQEWQNLREQIKQAEKQAKESGDQSKVLKLEEELYKLEQEQRNEKTLAGEKDKEKQRSAKEKNNETQKQDRLRETEQRITDLRVEIIAAEKADNNDKVVDLENALREVQKEQRHLEGKEDKEEIIKDSPEIVLSDGAEKKSQLENKLREYKSRIDKYKAPELQMSTICKIAVLERLLKDGKINTQELASEMSVSFGSGFSVEAFDNACSVIEDYCQTGGKNIKGGTGLESAVLEVSVEDPLEPVKEAEIVETAAGEKDKEKSDEERNVQEMTTEELKEEDKRLEKTSYKLYSKITGMYSARYMMQIEDIRKRILKIRWELEGRRAEGIEEPKEKTAKETTEKDPEYKGGLPAVIEGEKVRAEMTAEQTAKVETVLKEFNLTAEDAEKIEGFKDLSYGQRLLALQNLRQLTLRDVRIGSVKKQKEEAGQAQGFWKKMWTGIKKKYDIAKHEKSISQSLNKEDNLATLTQLTRGMKESKTDVIEKNGKLEFQYISGLENLTPEQAAKVQKFNEVASELSKMPMEWTADDSKKGFFRQMMDKAGLGQSWSPDDPTRGQYNRCQELTAEFQSLKQEVLQVVKQQKDADLKKGGIEKFDDWENQSHAMAQMLQMENLLRCNRAMNVNPDAEKALMEIKSAPLWKRALNNIATEKGIYMAAGFAARTVTVTFLGTAGLVGAGAGMGGYMGYKRGKETLRENDALAQHKSFEETEQKRIEKFQRAKQGKTGPIGEMEKTEKKIEDANVLARNLNNFVEYIGKEDDPKRQMDLARRLRDRVKYVKTALDEGRINFGATDMRVASLYELTDKLNDAVNCAEMYHPSTRHEDQWKKNETPEGLNLKEHKHLLTVEQRLDLYLKDSKIALDAERWKYLKKQLRNGALYGAGFVTAGMMVREVASHIDPHLFNAQGETDLGVRWISDKGGSSKPLVGGIVGKYLHGEPAGGGGGSIPPHEAGMPAGGGSEKIKSVIDQFNEDFRHHPEWKTNSLEQMTAVNNLQQQLESAGVKNPDALKEIIDSAKDQLNGDGNVFIVKGGSQEAQNLSGAEATGAGAGAGAGGSAAENTVAAAGGAGKAAETLAEVKSEATQLINEIKNVGGIKHDSIWRSVNELVRDHAKEMGMEYPGKGGTKLSEVEWYNLKASQLVNELDKSTPGGIKDLVHELDKVIAAKGSDGKFHIVLEESSGMKSGRLADLHHHVAGVKASVIENASSVPESAPIHPEPIFEPMINQPQATDHLWDNRPKQTAGNRLNEIFDYHFGPQGAETTTYDAIKDKTAEYVLKGNFSREVDVNGSSVFDNDDVRRYGELQEYLKELAKENNSAPKTGETVDQFIHRLNRDIVATPEHAVMDAAPGKTMPPHESSQKLEIDKELFKENPVAMPEINTPNNIHIANDKLVADIEFKYDSSGKPVDILVPKVQAGARIEPMNYLDKSNLQSFDARAEGVRLSTYMEIYNELKVEKMGEEANVVAEKIKEMIVGIEKTRHGIIDYSKIPQEIQKKLGK